MQNIYDKFDSCFGSVSAYVILKDGVSVGKICAKYPKDGAGRLAVYVHFFGETMLSGAASGYGYDKMLAACEKATKNVNTDNQLYTNFIESITKDESLSVQDNLRKAGFTVITVI